MCTYKIWCDMIWSHFSLENARKCKVLFSYKPANRDELELNIDDVIEVLGEVEEGWWKGELRNEVSTWFGTCAILLLKT